MSNQNCQTQKPCFFITKNKGRVKVYKNQSEENVAQDAPDGRSNQSSYNSTTNYQTTTCKSNECSCKSTTQKSVYLNNNDTFEIELFNPTTKKVLAKIYINDVLISSSGIVLKPGERIYLERYLDTPNKFVFSTYDVENTNEIQKAIESNGNIVVEFYDMYTPTTNGTVTICPYTIYPYYQPYYINLNGNITTTASLSTVTLGTSNNTTTANINSNYSTTYTYNNGINSFSTADNSIGKYIETGSVEQSTEVSNQSFNSDYSVFNSWYSVVDSIKILPASVKPIEKSDLRCYCVGCGVKRKADAWVFCPKCGTKF
jgi:hypothetical protein